ncbi:MAG: hypothetical protein COZ70_03595 [Deltaproteobacteria bacterium CG_4_8_14_3_um_filter_51_11]|nr:MAG: hypothetical protein COZ70_03595 [Deltaproteobacteria bacterium CG_4_8_14_3_um_filter_51_11]
MKNNQFGCKEIKSVCETKLEISFRGRKENNGWYLYKGRRATRITVPKGRHTVPKGTYRSMANQLLLTASDFDDLLECPLTRKKYDDIILSKLTF